MSENHPPEAPFAFSTTGEPLVFRTGGPSLLWTMAGVSMSVVQPRNHSIDWTKVRTVEDVVAILKGMRITVNEPSAQYDELKPYLVDTPAAP